MSYIDTGIAGTLTAFAVFKGRSYDIDQNTSNPSKESGSHRCEECGGTYGVHWAYDMSGIGCWACARCDDGTLSIA
jgi:hypothetical protein